MIKPTKWHVRPAKTQISLGIHPVWSGSSLCAQWITKDLSFLHADSEDSDQTGRMPRLIWVFAGRTVILLVLSWGGSILKLSICRENIEEMSLCVVWSRTNSGISRVLSGTENLKLSFVANTRHQKWRVFSRTNFVTLSYIVVQILSLKCCIVSCVLVIPNYLVL